MNRDEVRALIDAEPDMGSVDLVGEWAAAAGRRRAAALVLLDELDRAEARLADAAARAQWLGDAS